jgi:CRISPR-associated protein Cas2
MRTRYLVCYDICDPRRLRRVEKTVKSFGTRIQFSVFECPLDDMRLRQLQGNLKDIINTDHDQILFVSLGAETNEKSFRIEAMGQPYEQRSRVTIL